MGVMYSISMFLFAFLNLVLWLILMALTILSKFVQSQAEANEAGYSKHEGSINAHLKLNNLF